ncbi:hypothetical protein [Paenibacillus sp. LHD-38]|uniref:hypothetical protein n=1 Tax=Paenibacillus sp. LHD-38 TaxID=3072143 RepID=UPI00280E6BA3|nr:hypothetical protein [Paenibacillus sp. LHD-38]MDQ8734098.1 hypothetical protein [Paenibacillus sp. LHD-38]
MEDVVLKEISSYKLNEKNYLMFVDTPETDNKKITLYLPYSVNNINVKAIELMQNKELITKQIRVDSPNIIDNKLYFTLKEFVPFFNRANLILADGRTVSISTGQFYLQIYVTKDNVPQDKLKFSDSGHFKNINGKIEYSAQFSYKVWTDVEDVSIVLPDGLFPPLKAKDFKFIDSSDTASSYILALTFPEVEFKRHHVDSLTFEMLWAQKYEDKDAVILMGSVPIRLEDYSN